MAKRDFKSWLEQNEVPQTFGVYQFLNAVGEVIYVGKSVNLSRRMQQYLTSSRKKKYRKTKSIIQEVATVQFELCPDEKSALLRENELILNFKPRFNTAGAYSFLYPVIAANFSERRLALIRTTRPDHYVEYKRFGAFRDRHLIKEMFESLEFLLSMIGHKEPVSRLKDIPEADYSRRMAFREVQSEYWPLIQNFFAGKDDEFLRTLSSRLLSHPKALGNAREVEKNLKTLKSFYIFEAQRLHAACQRVGSAEIFVAQDNRDALFIEFGP